MSKHPEQRSGELYLGNAMPEDVMNSSWRTSRLGNTPLRTDGKPCENSRLRPWFITRYEVEAAINTQRLLGGPNHEEKIRVYETMLAEDPEPTPVEGCPKCSSHDVAPIHHCQTCTPDHYHFRCAACGQEFSHIPKP